MYKRVLKLTLLILILFLLGNFINPRDTAAEVIFKVSIEGQIDQGMAFLVSKGIEEAEKAGASKIILKIDTFGGLVDSGIKIRDSIIQTNLETITYVNGRAWSAGALIAMAGEKLIMEDGSSIGAAETRPREEKYISALRREFQATAERRGRNSEVAGAMVDSDVSIEGIIESNKLLSLTSSEALEYNIADNTVNSFVELQEKLNITETEFIETRLSPAENFARFITNPSISAILLTIALIAIMFEVIAPGFGFGGTIGLLGFGVFFSSYIIIGYAGWGLLILFLVGLVLLLTELFVIPGFGVTGIGGIIAILGSFYFLFPTPEIAIRVLAFVLILTITGTYVLVKIFGGTRIWRNISLNESQTKDTGYVSHNNQRDLAGKKGKASTPLRPTGIAIINEKRYDVVTKGDYIDKGEEIEVIEVSGSRIVVKKLKD